MDKKYYKSIEEYKKNYGIESSILESSTMAETPDRTTLSAYPS